MFADRTRTTSAHRGISSTPVITAPGGGMEDEYGEMDDSGETFAVKKFSLEGGGM